LNFINFFKQLLNTTHSNFPIVSCHVIRWCPFLKNTTIVYRQIFWLGNWIPIFSESEFWTFDWLKNLSLTWITESEYKEKIRSNVLVEKIHYILEDIFLELSDSSRGGFHYKENIVNSIKIFLKFFSNHLNYFFVFAYSSSISKPRSVNQTIHSMSIFVFDVVISDYRCDRSCLTFYILHNNIVSKIVLKLNPSNVIENCVQKCWFSTACFTKDNQGLGVYPFNLTYLFIIFKYFEPFFLSYICWALTWGSLYFGNIIFKLFKQLWPSYWPKLIN